LKSRHRYPSVQFSDHCSLGNLRSTKHFEAVVRGRLLACSVDHVCLYDETCEMELFCEIPPPNYVNVGDIVELDVFLNSCGVYSIKAYRVLVHSKRSFRSGDWEEYHGYRNKFNLLKHRSHILADIRRFFEVNGYTEIETPYLNELRGFDINIEQFKTNFFSTLGKTEYYLETSPESHMKRMLSLGFERIFQIGRCFRNGESSALHNPEFTMLEWYRMYANYLFIMDETERLVKSIFSEARFRGILPEDLYPIIDCESWPRITILEAFRRWAGIDLGACLDQNKLYTRLKEIGFVSANETDNWDDLFNKVLIEKIEPMLKDQGAVFLIDYPIQLAAMARQCDENANFAERAELYINGIELANGYTELNDPEEQRARFVDARISQQEECAIDEKFLMQLEVGLPPAGGIALGVDRLVMIATGSSDLKQVISF
jgi:EF-P lysine aminoacylase GenX